MIFSKRIFSKERLLFIAYGNSLLKHKSLLEKRRALC